MSQTFTKTFYITPPPTYNLDLTLQTWARWDPDYKYYDPDIKNYWQTISCHGKSLLIIASQPQKTKLKFQVLTHNSLTKQDHELTRKKLINLFNLDVNLPDFYKYIKSTDDKVMKQLIKHLHGLSFIQIYTVFEAMVEVIISQEISGKVAVSFITKIYKLLGKKFNIKNQTYYLFPTPQDVFAKPKSWYRNLGLTNLKAEEIRRIAKKFITKELDEEKLRELPTPQLKEILLDLKGIGEWSANNILLRAFGRTDVSTSTDLDFIKAVKIYYNVTSEKSLQKIVSNWGPWQGLANIYLVTAKRLNIKL